MSRNPYHVLTDSETDQAGGSRRSFSIARGLVASLVAATAGMTLPFALGATQLAVTLAALFAGIALALFTPARPVPRAPVVISISTAALIVTVLTNFLWPVVGWQRPTGFSPDKFAFHRGALRTTLILAFAVTLTTWIALAERPDNDDLREESAK